VTISEQTETFFGRTVVQYESGEPVALRPADTVYRLSLEHDDDASMADLLEEFLGEVDAAQVEALVIGPWDEPFENGPAGVIETLVRRAADLPRLKALFIGDMTYEECEISWIIQGDYAPLLAAFPKLEALRIRGSTSLVLPAFRHAGLRELAIECGGLPKEVMATLAASSAPALERLELWLGTDNYGFDGKLADVTRMVDALRTPGLRYLGLRDAEIADEVAAWLATQPWVAQLDTLDLSLGTLGDEGAKALLASPHLKSLKRLDLSHHYISEPLQNQLRAALPQVVLDDPQEDDEGYRYVAVGE
jgi:hypothetical protein